MSDIPLGSTGDTPAGVAGDDFEASLRQLESVVEELERGDLPLESSLSAYRRGVELVRVCQQHLSRAEQQVKVLEADLLRPLQADDLRGDA